MSNNFKRPSRVAWIVLGGAVLSGCALTIPQTNSDFQNTLYVGAGVLLSQLEPDTSRVDGVGVDDSDGTGGSVLLGYDINDRLTIEGHLADLGEASFSPAGSIGYQVGGLSGLVYGFNSEQNRDQRRGLSVFGRLGVGALDNEADGVRYKRVNDVHLLAGAGLEYGFNNALAARVELVGHETDARYAQLALLYRFGGSETTESAVPVPDPVVVDEPVVEALVIESAVVEPAVVESPVVESETPGVGFEGVVEGIQFRVNSAELTDGAITVLEEIVQALKDNPDINMTIEAHTDNAGDAEENLQLSRRRALAVVRFLVDEGISGLRLKPQAFGESQPRASNATAQGRAANRRVEVRIFK